MRKCSCCAECPADFTYIVSVNGCYRLVTSKQEWSFTGLQCRSLHKDAHLYLSSKMLKNRRRLSTCSHPATVSLLVRPETIVFGRYLCFAGIYLFFFFPSRNLRAPWADRREILYDARKYVWFYNPGPKFWGCLPKKFRGQKHAKFGPISVDFKVRRQISPEWMKIFKIGELHDR